MCSAEESSTQVEIAFSRALEQEDLWHAADLAATDTLVKALVDGDAEVIDRAIADGDRPLLLAISDNGPQMRSHSTREFLAGVASPASSEDPDNPKIRPGSRPCSDTSRANGHTWRRSATAPNSTPNSSASRATTTRCGSRPPSATSPHVTNTKDAVTPSAKPAATDSPAPAPTASTTVAT